MNISGGALIILFLAIPGWLFHSTFRGKWLPGGAERFKVRSAIEESFLILSVAAVAHAACLLLMHAVIYRPNWHVILSFLMSAPKEQMTQVIASVESNLFIIIVYLAIVSVFCFTLGWLVRLFVLTFMPLGKYKMMGFGSGMSEFLSDLDSDDYSASIAVVVNGSYIYRGFFESLFLDGDEVCYKLSAVERRPIESDRQASKEISRDFYPIEGDYLILRTSDFKTLNVLRTKPALITT